MMVLRCPVAERCAGSYLEQVRDVSQNFPKSNYRNRILSGMDDDDYNLIRPYLAYVDLAHRLRLETPNRAIETVYFIETGLVSIVASNRVGNKHAEVGLIGFEGMTGLAVVNGAMQSPNEAVMQSEGSAYCIEADRLRKIIEYSSSLFKRFSLYAFQVQTAYTILTNAEGAVEQRLSRWLLMAHDRIGEDELKLTHETLSIMLGVRRPGVTIALQRLEQRELITTRRGSVVIANRRALEDYADGYYGVPESEYERLFNVR